MLRTINSFTLLTHKWKFNMLKKIVLGSFGLLISYISFAQSIPAAKEDSKKLVGDIGIAAFQNASITNSKEGGASILPYAYATYGDFFARIDTLGMKVFPMGNGNFEISTRISFEGYKQKNTSNPKTIANPTPFGISTAQITPYGAFFAHSFYDPVSGGNLIDMSYAAQFKLGSFSVYPRLGVERRSAKYAQHLYGATTGPNLYTADSSLGTNIGMTVDYPIDQSMSLKLNFRKNWMDRNITDSPIISSKSQLNGFIAVTHSFK